jgi:hypothetical protein
MTADIIQKAFGAYQLDKDNNLVIPNETAQEVWRTNHISLYTVRKLSGKWLAQHRDYGITNYGVEFVSETESQVLMDLGINLPPAKPDCNGEGKAKGFVSIEGISQNVSIWWRTVSHLVPKWNADQIERARQLLRPALEIDNELKRLMGDS